MNLRKVKDRSPIFIALLVALIWLALLPFFYEQFFTTLYYMPFLGALAATIANITPAAAGIVYFPILTHIDMAPVTVTQFSLMIQAYGMGLGTFRWFVLNRKLFIFNVIPISIAGGLLGEIISIVFLPIKNPELLTLVFNFIAFVFTQIIFFSLLKNAQYPIKSIVLNWVNRSILFLFAFIGGLLCGWIGFGIDTIFYFILTIFFRINPAASIVTSISLMAAMSVTGTVLNCIFQDMPLPFSLFYSAIPGVTFAGLFFAAYIAVKMGSRNILLLFTFFLTIDFLTALWNQGIFPMSDLLKKMIIYPLGFYMLAIHIRLFINNYNNKDGVPGDFNAVGEVEIE
ncbi:MAG: sulfite exporter TauE/SafE family protein [Desulfamplus sp.]|nr:sulfite exporter TauE/SafE family protein [Desulfamplus sp.]